MEAKNLDFSLPPLALRVWCWVVPVPKVLEYQSVLPQPLVPESISCTFCLVKMRSVSGLKSRPFASASSSVHLLYQ